MDTTTLRIIDIISSNIGNALSINQLTKYIKNTHGSAYYANIYQKIQELKNEGLLNVEPMGNSSNVKLNFQNCLLTDALAEMEIEKKRHFLKSRTSLFPVLEEINKTLANLCAVKSISSINPSNNIKLNRLELLFLLKDAPNYLKEATQVYRSMIELQNRHNLKINSLILSKKDFLEFLSLDEINPIKEALSNKIVFFGAQAFWTDVKEAAVKSQIQLLKPETKPAGLSSADLTFNLNRFGYREFGWRFAEGRKFCVELTVTAILLQDDARLTEAAAVVLAKNRFSSNMLVFLSQKYDVAGKMLGLLRVLDTVKPKQEITETIKLLEMLCPIEVRAEEEGITEKLRLYHAL
jgi:hypothetical protein